MSNYDKVINLTIMQLQNETTINEERIKTLVDVFAMMNPVSEIEKGEIIKELHSRLSVKMDRGSLVKAKDHVSWYYNAKKDFEHRFWSRYTTYLISEKRFNNDVVNTLDNTTDEMMDLLGNPNSIHAFQRRGLVIGDVQSGKTSTYTGLINKAADSGYRVIILLTGTIEKLRKQTQERIDEGFVGLDSKVFTHDRDSVNVGVGNYDSSISAWSITSTSSDFNKATANKLMGKITAINAPVIFVLKKNKSVLEKLEQWLRTFNTSITNGKIDLPMLLIDDEADNASVNTNDDESPTIINANIRKLLKLFEKANYVGFTATPYANIFINPDSTQEMLEDDLFPKDFIFALEPPTNYIGARDIYGTDGDFEYMLKSNDDCEMYIPMKHKKEYKPEKLPRSMKEAIISFFIAITIRDLRGHKGHRSMLINVSRFIIVQNNLTRLVDSYVRDLQRVTQNYYKLDDISMYEEFQWIKWVFDKHFSGSSYTWQEVQKNIYPAISSIVVRTVNGGNAAKNLNYDEYEDEGLRIIAVGGISLSRGLTLEGLMTSYFYRNSKMYDTLMQMGRWFGYRDKYADLCQVWMSEEAIDWYSYISEASDELRSEVKRMQAQNKTPMDFGLSVRSDISTLLVTARNKMKSAQDYEFSISLNGKMVETPFLPMTKSVIEQNYAVTMNFIESLVQKGFTFASHENLEVKSPQFLDVPKSRIISLLKEFEVNNMNTEFRPEYLVDFIENYEDETLNYWDVAIGHGNSTETIEVLDRAIPCVERKFDVRLSQKALQMSGNKSRLGSVSFAKSGLTKTQVSDIETVIRNLRPEKEKNKGFSQNAYFNSGIYRKPLLVVYPVELKLTEGNGSKGNTYREKEVLIDQLPKINIGLSIGIPKIDNLPIRKQKFKINLVKYKELFEIDDDDFYEEDENYE